MPNFDRVEPNPAVKDLSKAKIALVTSGGIVPKGNPDHIESSSASKYGEYSLEGFDDLTAETHETAHGGYDPVYANEDADRVLPVDVMRDLVKEGVIGSLHEKFYTTVGNGTVVHICTVVPISLTVGANRIVPAIAIPHPLGDPKLDHDEEKKLRRKLVDKALHALTVEVDGQTVFE